MSALAAADLMEGDWVRVRNCDAILLSAPSRRENEVTDAVDLRLLTPHGDVMECRVAAATVQAMPYAVPCGSILAQLLPPEELLDLEDACLELAQLARMPWHVKARRR